MSEEEMKIVLDQTIERFEITRQLQKEFQNPIVTMRFTETELKRMIFMLKTFRDLIRLVEEGKV